MAAPVNPEPDPDSDPVSSPGGEPLPTLTPARAVRRGLTRRCPQCGARGTFSSWFTPRERCPTCNYPTMRVPDQWIGGLGINTMVTFTLLVLGIAGGVVATYPDIAVAPLTVGLGLFAGLFPVVFYPVSKSLWAGIDLAMRPVDPDDDVDPRHLSPTRTGRPTSGRATGAR